MQKKSITVTPEVIELIRIAVENAGGQKKFATESGVSQSRISQILNGEATYIRPKLSENLQKYLKKQINKQVSVVQNNVNGNNHAQLHPTMGELKREIIQKIIHEKSIIANDKIRLIEIVNNITTSPSNPLNK